MERILASLASLEAALDGRLEEHPAYSPARADELVAQAVALLALAIERAAVLREEDAELLAEIGAWLVERRGGVDSSERLAS